MNDEKKKQSVPAFLRQDLSIVRQGLGFKKRYLIKNRETDVVIELGEEEFHLIRLLSDGLKPEAVCRGFLAKFGKRITTEELEGFTDYLNELGMTASAGQRSSEEVADKAAPMLDEGAAETDEMTANSVEDDTASAPAVTGSPEGTVAAGSETASSRQDERRKWRRDRRQRKSAPVGEDKRRHEDKSTEATTSQDAGDVVASVPGEDSADTQASSSNNGQKSADAETTPAADIVGDEDAIIATAPASEGGESEADAEEVDREPRAAGAADEDEAKSGELIRAPRSRRKRQPAAGSQGFRDSRPAAEGRDGEDTRRGRKSRFWIIFNPDAFLATTANLLAPLRFLTYLLPVLVPVALLALANNSYELHGDIERLLAPVTLIQHLVFSLLTVNLLSRLASGLVARYYGAEVKGFGIILAFGIIPRFFMTMQKAWELPQKARLWVFAAPLLTKLFLFACGVLLWLFTRHLDNLLSFFSLTLWLTAITSFVVTANPLLTSDGYRLLATYLGIKDLRAVARKRLFAWFRGEVPEDPELSTAALIAYAVASMLFTLLVSVLIAFFVATWLQVNLQGIGIILALFFLVFMVKRGLNYAKHMKEGLEGGSAAGKQGGSSAWRKRIKVKRRDQNTAKRRFRLAMLLLLVPILFLPYPYETGGKFTFLPAERQEIHVEVEGLVEDVFHDGGEPLTKGAVIAKLSTFQTEKELAVNEAKVREKEAQIAELKTTPRPEQLRLAESEVNLAKVQLKFSLGELARYEDLYKKKAVSLDDLEEARRRVEIDKQKIIEAEAKLDLVKAGPHPDEIAAAEAEKQRYLEQVNFYREELRRSTLSMPFDGHIVELNLRQHKGRYLKKGDLFTEVENAEILYAAIEVPETDIGEVAIGSTSTIKTWAFPDQPFEGQVTHIDPRVIEQPFGNVVKVMVRLDNSAGRLRSGMSGYAKVRSEDRPVWEAFTRMIVRFVMVESWSWIP